MRIKRFYIIMILQAMLCSLFYAVPYAEKERSGKLLFHQEHQSMNVELRYDESTSMATLYAEKEDMEASKSFYLVDPAAAHTIEWSTQQAIVTVEASTTSQYVVKILFSYGNDHILIQQSTTLSEEGMKQYALQQEEKEREAEKQKEEQRKQNQKADAAVTIDAVKTITSADQIKDTLWASGTMTDQIGHDQDIYHAAKNTTYDLKIEAGKVQVTQDGGTHWITVPIGGERLQNHWESYYRLRDSSVYIDNDSILIAHTLQYTHPHILVSMDRGKTWKDIRLKAFDDTCIQVAFERDANGDYQIALMSQQHKVSYGTSKNGIDWTFQKTYNMPVEAGTYVSMGLMKDKTILLSSFEECAMTRDGGKTFTYLSDDDKALAKDVDSGKRPYEKDGVYHIPLLHGEEALSKDQGKSWYRASS